MPTAYRVEIRGVENVRAKLGIQGGENAFRRRAQRSLKGAVEDGLAPAVRRETPRGTNSPWVRYGRKGPAADNIWVKSERPGRHLARARLGYGVAHARWMLHGTQPHEIQDTWGIPGFKTMHPGHAGNDVYGRALKSALKDILRLFLRNMFDG